MISTKRTASLAGALYLVNAVTGFFGIICGASARLRKYREPIGGDPTDAWRAGADPLVFD